MDSTRTSSYLPSLDGWRAVAILSVIFYQSTLHTAGPVSMICNAIIRNWHFAFVMVLLVFVWLPQGSALQATALAFAMPGVVLCTVSQPASRATRLLQWSPLRWIGRISYSLYLWQQLFFTERFLDYRPLGRLERWPLNLLLIFLVASLSYYGVERPLVRLGHRLTTRRTAVVAASV